MGSVVNVRDCEQDCNARKKKKAFPNGIQSRAMRAFVHRDAMNESVLVSLGEVLPAERFMSPHLQAIGKLLKLYKQRVE